ncbi:MAG: response regulator transcription factor [Cyanobacteria bacterium SIG30]|nr:response regulator transcription factor [Cyanobacteria bacterium SIG30]
MISKRFFFVKHLLKKMKSNIFEYFSISSCTKTRISYIIFLMKKQNILIVEDHALTRFALVTSLKDVDFVGDIYEAENAAGAYDILNQHNIQIVLMDLGLPGINGVKATKEIKRLHKKVKVIVITSHNEEAEVLECLEAGISAYCSKDIKPDKLIELIKDVIEGSIWFDSKISEYVLNAARNIKPVMSLGKRSGNHYNLTSKELKVLELIKVGNSNSEIAKKLNISINTTKVHVCAILQKLEVDDRTQAAIKAINDNIVG